MGCLYIKGASRQLLQLPNWATIPRYFFLFPIGHRIDRPHRDSPRAVPQANRGKVAVGSGQDGSGARVGDWVAIQRFAARGHASPIKNTLQLLYLPDNFFDATTLFM